MVFAASERRTRSPLYLLHRWAPQKDAAAIGAISSGIFSSEGFTEVLFGARFARAPASPVLQFTSTSRLERSSFYNF